MIEATNERFSSAEEEERYLNTLNEHMLARNFPVPDTTEQENLEKVQLGYFPPSMQPYARLRNLKELKDQIQFDKRKYKRLDLKYNIRKGYTNICAYCWHCRKLRRTLTGQKKISLSFNKKAGVYILRYFDNYHYHHYHQSLNLKTKSQSQLNGIRRQLLNSPVNMDLDDFKSLMTQKYKIKLAYVRSNLYIIRRQTIDFNQVLTLAKMLDCSYWFKNQISDEKYYSKEQGEQVLQRQPQLFFFVVNDMIQRYKDHGDVVYLMIMDFVLHDQGNRKWKVLALSGISLGSVLEPFVFAYLDLSKMDVTVITSLLGFIFHTLGKTPKVLITPSQRLYDDLVGVLKVKGWFFGLHIYDPILQIDKMGGSLEYKELSLLKKIILCRTKREYKDYIQQVFKECQAGPAFRAQLRRLMKIRKKVCFSCIQTGEFMGPIFEVSGSKLVKEKTREGMITKGKIQFHPHSVKKQKDQIQNEKKLNTEAEQADLKKGMLDRKDAYFAQVPASSLNFIRCVKLMMNLMKKEVPTLDNRSSYDDRHYETITDIEDMLCIRKHIKVHLFSIFGQQFSKIHHLSYSQRPEHHGQLKVFNIYDRLAKSVFVVGPQAVYNPDTSFSKIVSRCNCLFGVKCGIPCAHEILVTMLTNSSLFDLFRDQFKVERKYFKKGKPPRSRRNTEK